MGCARRPAKNSARAQDVSMLALPSYDLGKANPTKKEKMNRQIANRSGREG